MTDELENWHRLHEDDFSSQAELKSPVVLEHQWPAKKAARIPILVGAPPAQANARVSEVAAFPLDVEPPEEPLDEPPEKPLGEPLEPPPPPPEEPPEPPPPEEPLMAPPEEPLMAPPEEPPDPPPPEEPLMAPPEEPLEQLLEKPPEKPFEKSLEVVAQACLDVPSIRPPEPTEPPPDLEFEELFARALAGISICENFTRSPASMFSATRRSVCPPESSRLKPVPRSAPGLDEPVDRPPPLDQDDDLQLAAVQRPRSGVPKESKGGSQPGRPLVAPPTRVALESLHQEWSRQQRMEAQRAQAMVEEPDALDVELEPLPWMGERRVHPACDPSA